MQPPELREPTAATVGSDQTPLRDTVSREHYRQDSRSATFHPLRLAESAELAARVLKKAVDDVRRHPPTLPLWSFRLCQHVNCGTYGYQRVWDALELAAVDGGASEAWARRVLFRSFADAVANRGELMPLNILAGGLH